MSDLRQLCALCGEPVDPLAQTTYQQYTGWGRTARVRASGKHGGNDIRLRRPLQRWAHSHCVDRGKRTGHATQQTLV